MRNANDRRDPRTTVTVAFISASISIRSRREKYEVALPPRGKEGACKGCVMPCLTASSDPIRGPLTAPPIFHHMYIYFLRDQIQPHIARCPCDAMPDKSNANPFKIVHRAINHVHCTLMTMIFVQILIALRFSLKLFDSIKFNPLNSV